MADHEDRSSDGLEQSDAQVFVRVCRVGEHVTRWLSPKLLGIVILLQEIKFAAAASSQEALNSRPWSHMGLIGLIPAFQTEASTKSLAYAALHDSSYYLTGHIGPGTLSVAAVLFGATEFSLARLFALGGKRDAYSLVGLDCPDGLRYVGLKSYTECTVANAVGAAIVREQNALWEKERQDFLTKNSTTATQPEQEGVAKNQNVHEQDSREQNGNEKKTTTLRTLSKEEGREEEGTKMRGSVGRDAGRSVKVIVLKIKREEQTTQKANEAVEEEAGSKIRVPGGRADKPIMVSLLDIDERADLWAAVLATLSLPAFLLTTVIYRQGFLLPLFATTVMLATALFNVVPRFGKREPAMFLSGLLPSVLTLIVIFSCCMYKLWFVGGLILCGSMGMIAAVMGIRHGFVFKYTIPKPLSDAPEGDCVVIDDKNPDIFHIIQADEASIQKLFQRKIQYEATLGKKMLLMAGFMLYLYMICSVLFLPGFLTTAGKIHFTIANSIGFVADMYKASRNANLGLAKKARRQFQIDYQGELEFKNRTAAVAFVAKHAVDCMMLRSKKLLPCDGPVWEKWWAELSRRRAVEPIANPKQDTLKENLLNDMEDGLAASLPDYRPSTR